MTIAEMQTTYPTIPWLKTFNIMLAPILTVDENEIVIVQNPQYLEKLNGVLKKTPKRYRNCCKKNSMPNSFIFFF